MPPVPWRKLAIGGLVMALVLGVAAALAIPRIDRSKDEGAARERADLAQRRAAARRGLVAEQRPVRAGARPPDRPLGRAAEVRARRGLLGRVERAITADTARRAKAGTLDRPAVRTQCVPAPSSVKRAGAERVPGRRRDVYDCLGVTRDIPPSDVSRGGALGHPFRAVVDFGTFRFVWCKTNPSAGEAAAPDPRSVPELPRACRLP